MGTRHVTTIYDTGFDKNNLVANIYGQWDGYPSGHGAKLAEFLTSRQMTNGLPGLSTQNDKEKIYANGAGCLAAQLIAHIKKEPGSIYLTYGNEKTDHGQDYNYIVRANYTGINVEIVCGGDVIFNGVPDEMVLFCNKEDTED